MKAINILSVFLVFILISLSCKKNVTKTNAQLLTQENWKLTNQRQKIITDSWIDDYSTIQDCRKDNVLQYATDYTYSVDEGITKCSSSDPQIIITGSWYFQNNDSELVVNAATSATQIFRIMKLDETTLQITSSVMAGVTYEYTYGH